MKIQAHEIESQLREHPGWTATGDALTRIFAFKTFPDAIAFVARLAFDAEAADHHPDLDIRYRKVTVTWSTHSEGGVTEKDFAGVRQSDMIAARIGANAA
jgi:4a-hydroxytetrahydrobiopterin dehydratase